MSPSRRPSCGPWRDDAVSHAVRKAEVWLQAAGLSPAHSLCTGQNAETRSNGAPLGRPMLLFLTRTLNMPGAAGFSAQGWLLLYERHNTTAQLPGAQSGQQMEEKPPLFRFFVREWGLTAGFKAATCRISTQTRRFSSPFQPFFSLASLVSLFYYISWNLRHVFCPVRMPRDFQIISFSMIRQTTSNTGVAFLLPLTLFLCPPSERRPFSQSPRILLGFRVQTSFAPFVRRHGQQRWISVRRSEGVWGSCPWYRCLSGISSWWKWSLRLHKVYEWHKDSLKDWKWPHCQTLTPYLFHSGWRPSSEFTCRNPYLHQTFHNENPDLILWILFIWHLKSHHIWHIQSHTCCCGRCDATVRHQHQNTTLKPPFFLFSCQCRKLTIIM